MPGGAFHRGIFKDNAPGAHQRRPKLSLSFSLHTPCRSLRRGLSRSCWRPSRPTWPVCTCWTRPVARTPPPEPQHLVSSPHPCSPSRPTSPELRVRTPQPDSRRPKSSNPAGWSRQKPGQPISATPHSHLGAWCLTSAEYTPASPPRPPQHPHPKANILTYHPFTLS